MFNKALHFYRAYSVVFVFIFFGFIATLFFSISDKAISYFQSGDHIAKGLSHTIELRENGFYPKEITIEKGSMVIFTTTLGKSFWPASSRHPVHELYPEFDPKQPISLEKSWNFTFDKVGIWGYHDHLFSKYTGTIVVLDPENGITKKKDIIKSCGNSSEETGDCLTAQLIAIAQTQGLKEGFDAIEKQYDANYFFYQGLCHGLTHYLGGIAYEQHKKGKQITPDPRFGSCGFGFYHGFIESLLYDTGDIYAARNFCDYIRNTAGGTGAIFNGCIHGFGHGVTDTATSETWGNPQAIIAPGLHFCKQITHNEYDLENCSGGVFDALSIMRTRPEYKLSFGPSELLGLCKSQEKFEFKSGCYRNITGVLFHYFFKRNFWEAASYLAAIDDAVLRGGAMDNLSIRAARVIASEKNNEQLIEDCRGLADSIRVSCITGFVAGLMLFSSASGNEYERPLALCKESLLLDTERKACFTRMNWLAKVTYEQSKFNSFCAAVPADYRYFCSEDPRVSNL